MNIRFFVLFFLTMGLCLVFLYFHGPDQTTEADIFNLKAGNVDPATVDELRQRGYKF